MASYEEIRTLFNDSALRNRTATAVIIAANGILGETAPVDVARKAWANKAFSNPESEAKRVLMAVLAANNGATVPQIQGASDSALQTNVDNAIDLFIDADAGV